MSRSPRPYTDPYLAGIGIGLVLLTAYVVVGQGLGASGAFASVVASGTAAVQGTSRAAASAAVAPYLPDGIASPLRDWLVLELAGVMPAGSRRHGSQAGFAAPPSAARTSAPAADVRRRRRRRVMGLVPSSRVGARVDRPLAAARCCR